MTKVNKIRVCNKCNKNLTLDCFYKDKSRKLGHRYTCKNCEKILAKKWYKDNIERERLKDKYYYDSNRELCISRVINDQQKNMNRHLKTMKKYYNGHKKEKSEYNKDYHFKHKKKNNERSRKRYKEKREEYINSVTNRKRNMKFINILPNIFIDKNIEYHHINNFFTVPIPKKIHRSKLGLNHKEKCNDWISDIYNINIGLFLNE
jgi:hypothetical protein